MKRFFNSCRRHCQNICLLAGGALPETEKDRTMNHLAACPDCQKYYFVIKSVTAPLTKWEEHFARIHPSHALQARWAATIDAAGRPVAVRQPTATTGFREWYHDVIWPCRRIWASLATVWLLIFAGHLSLGEHSQIVIAKSSRLSQQQMIMALKERQTILAELLADHSTPRDADRRKFFLPKPRTEYLKELIA